MEDFTEILANLTDEQKAQLAVILSQNETKETPKKRGRPKKKEIIIPKGLEDAFEEEEERPVEVIHKPKRRVAKISMDVDDDDEIDDDIDYKGKPKRKKIKDEGEGKVSRREGLQTGERPNLFEKFPEFNSEKQFVKEDKANLRKFGVSPRARAGFCEVTCVRCHRDFEVGIGLAHGRYVCDRCITEKG